MDIASLGIYTLLLVVVTLLVVWLVTNKKSVKVSTKHLVLGAILMSALGPLGEIFVGTVYQYVAGFPLWQYQIFPVHHAYTSLYAPVIWAIGGVELCLMDAYLRGKTASRMWRHIFLAVDILIVELLINIGLVLAFGQMIFRYTPGDLLHFSSLQTLPFYFIAGLVFTGAFKILKPNSYRAALLFGFIMFVVVFLAN